MTRLRTLRDQARLERAYGDYLRLMNEKPGEAMRHMLKGADLREELDRMIQSARLRVLRPDQPEESAPAGGLEEVAEAVRAAVEFFGRERTLLEAFLMGLRPVVQLNSEDSLRGVAQMQELQRLKIEPFLVLSRIKLPGSTAVLSPLKVYAEGALQGMLRDQWEGTPIELLDEEERSLAGVVVGTEAFVRELRADASMGKKLFLQVDEKTVEQITALFLANLASDVRLFPPGTVILVGLLVQSDLADAVLIFA